MRHFCFMKHISQQLDIVKHYIKNIFCTSVQLQVHGIVRRSSSFNTGRIEHLYKNPQAHIEGSKYASKDMKLHYGDLTDSTCLVKIINEVKPSEIYNLGAQSHVK
ncbi:hypothetical protein Chor_003117, partial [Crotalus horridus]